MEVLSYWPWLAVLAALAVTVAASIHAILFKRNVHAALAWLAVFWMLPVLGAMGYYVLGINRIQRRARRMKRRARKPKPPAGLGGDLPPAAPLAPPPEAAHLLPLAQLGETVTGLPLLPGNAVQPLHDGDEAYPMMLQAIDDAKQSITLCVYIFDNDATGHAFADALGRAVGRGVEVRVLVDDIGANHRWSSIVGTLLLAKIPTACFHRRWLLRTTLNANLRNHRKLLIIDGHIAFTGGMNISEGHWLARNPPDAVHDLHFRVEGPIVAQMQAVFVEDWTFTTGEPLHGERWFPKLEPRGAVLARGVTSGPDEDLEKLRLLLLGALASARTSVRIVTPYFLPDPGLVSALNIAALRGVRVDILLPSLSDHRLTQWASMAQLPEVLEYGCRVWLAPPPFVHTKLMIVDGVWTMLGSANWDARSLWLNFEFNVECYDRALAAQLEADVEKELARSERMTLEKWQRRSFWIKLRDGTAHLLAPLL